MPKSYDIPANFARRNVWANKNDLGVLDYLASLGGHMGEAFTTLQKPCGQGPLGLLWLHAFKRA